jgi:poly(ADP-ribose) glycohydrolase
MSERFAPFTAAQCESLRAALESPTVRDVNELAALRASLTDVDHPLTALRALAREDTDWSARFFERAVPALLDAAWALVAQGVPSIPVHTAGRRARAVIPRAVIPGWLAHLFLGTLPRPSLLHPSLNGGTLLLRDAPHELAKLQCMMELFVRARARPLAGRLTVERRVAPPRDEATWGYEKAPLSPFTVDPHGLIEDADDHLQADFANRYLGGGVLTGGCVQEEIRFSVAPELLMGMVVSPMMEAREAVLLHGAERFAAVQGYGYKMRFDGAFTDAAPRLADGTPDVSVVAFDALDFRKGDPAAQTDPTRMLRELEKARAAFLHDARSLPVATGNWGAGAFLGDPQLKAVLQWIAASACKRAVRYFTFGDARVDGLAAFAAQAPKRFDSAGALWKRALTVAPQRPDDLFAALLA